MFKLLCLILCIGSVFSFKVLIRYDYNRQRPTPPDPVDVYIWPIDTPRPPQATKILMWRDPQNNAFFLNQPYGWYNVNLGTNTQKIFFGSRDTYLITDGTLIGYF